MGTSLSGLLPQDTYQGLIKVGDNTAITSTLKTLSDGAGNNLPMQASSTGINFTGTTSGLVSGVSGAIQFSNGSAFASDAANLFWDDANNRLGLGISTPLGILHLKVAAGTTRMLLDGDAGQSKIITYRTAGLQRWGLYSNNVAESGSNAGSNFVLRRYNDAGTLLGTPLEVNRATGVTKIGEGLDLNGSVLNNFIPNTASTSANLTLNSTNASTYNSSVIALTGALTITFDASLPNGFNVTLIQLDAAISTIAGTGGLVIGNRQGHGKNNGQYSVVSIIKYTNTLAILGGDTSL
jgi:hypothetical protein